MDLTNELIARKRDGLNLSSAEIGRFVSGVTDGSVSDAQIAALVMAIWFQGMDVNEQRDLTFAMRSSGEILSWEGLDGPILDKHSTGGVGDLVSLVTGPLIAACGAFVPMISGRGLGHTGGTLDKLESIPGFSTALDVTRFKELVRRNGVAIIGQTSSLAPADRRIYAVRDVTATVASVPLIVASILSKKLAEGLDGLVMDIKFGSGAFMREIEEAQALACEISRVAVEAGLHCNALITDMGQPLAWTAGNALEVREAIAFLSGERHHPRLKEVALGIAAEMLCLGGLADSNQSAMERLDSALQSGAAAESFARMVTDQGGPADLLESPHRHLGSANVVKPVHLSESGFIGEMDMYKVGMAVVHLGGGRQRVEDHVDPVVGLSELAGLGQAIDPSVPLAVLHASSEYDWSQAALMLQSAVRVDDRPVAMEAAVRGKAVEGVLI
jgi:thymidine phosphorylase